MPSPDLRFAANLQNQERWGPRGLSFKGFLDEFSLIVPRVVRPGQGETFTTSCTEDDFRPRDFADFTAVGAIQSQGTPTNAGFLWNLYRLTSLTAIDIVLVKANANPNHLMAEDERFRRMALVRVMADALANGDGELQWLGFDRDAFPKTIIDSGDASAAAVLETLRQIDDACQTNELGHRATCFVTTERGRRNCEAAQEQSGFQVQYGLQEGIENPVPYYRGRPIVVSSGLYDQGDQAPIYAVDFSQTFFLCTSGSPESWCIGEEPMPLQTTGVVGKLLYVHGALIAVTDRAYVKSTITTALSR